MPELNSILNLLLITPDGEAHDSEVPGDYTAEQLISDLVGALELPWVDEHNKLVHYFLETADNGVILEAKLLLVDQGIKDGDKVTLKANKAVARANAGMITPMNPPVDNP